MKNPVRPYFNRHMCHKKWWIFEYECVGDISQLKIGKYAVYQRVGLVFSIFGKVFDLVQKPKA